MYPYFEMSVIKLNIEYNLRTLKQTNKLKGIVRTTSTQDRTMRIRPHCVASPFVPSSAVNIKLNNSTGITTGCLFILKIGQYRME